ncbi:hypothetical protein FZEAL_5389 [Fusarium zealandicum]|uniref:GMP synthase (glutamine-hydrolyzing) n=1 Tax=Fusarium zealandicum TaxID=1053134 RepID=A0A8H4UKP3_9HYPO|nr:hypothetical protein FZEAL_5389 [Fusarium zealandicum]
MNTQSLEKAFDTVLVLDFGITRRLREPNVFFEMLPSIQKILSSISSPRALSCLVAPIPYTKKAPRTLTRLSLTSVCYLRRRNLWAPADNSFLGVPILVICYGMQEIAYRANSANVIAGTRREYGHAMVRAQKIDGHVGRLFEGLEAEFKIWRSHGDKLSQLPEGFHTVASSDNSEYAAIAHATKPIYALQFRPKVAHTQNGTALLKNFAVDICQANQNWTMAAFLEEEIARIRALVGEKGQVLGAVSGGVDSTVSAKLMKEAIGDRSWAVLVNNGVMRLNECEQVRKDLTEHLGINLIVDPEKKRKFIGGKFIECFEAEAKKIEKEAESSPRAGKIEFFLRPITMSQLLYEDEVRQLGRTLGISEELVMRADGCHGYSIELFLTPLNMKLTQILVEFPWSFLAKVTNRIVNEVDGVTRVVYECTSKPPATIEMV